MKGFAAFLEVKEGTHPEVAALVVEEPERVEADIGQVLLVALHVQRRQL